MKSNDTENEIKIFLKNIAVLRHLNSLTKNEMAKILKIGIVEVEKIERGELPPSITIEVIFEIHKHFGINPKDQFKPLC